MGKCADLKVVQVMIINTLCKGSKLQKVIAQKAVCGKRSLKIGTQVTEMTTDFCGLSRIWKSFISSRLRHVKSCHTQASSRNRHSPESEAALLKLHYCSEVQSPLFFHDLGCHVICWCFLLHCVLSRPEWTQLVYFRALHVSIFWQVLWRWQFLLFSRRQHLPTVPKSLPNALLTKLLLCLISPSSVCGVLSTGHRKMRNTQP